MFAPAPAPGRLNRSVAASLVLHLAAVAGLVALGGRQAERELERNLAFEARGAVRLVAPPPAPAEVRLEDLLERPRLFLPPQAAAPRPAPPPVPPPPRAPAIETARIPPPPLPAVTLEPPAAPPPPKIEIEPEERPRLAFERPQPLPAPPGAPGLIRPPVASLEEAIREAARSRGGGLVVGDLDAGAPGDISEFRSLTPAPPRSTSNLELLSDPMGVDFRPYLVRVLAAVRRNWMAVMPESARLGRRGKVVLQLAINREGRVPKLVIAESSGAEPLDRAAVAAITASDPFPPLPEEFRGEEVRLQFNFRYNLR
jgi:TonB family protein